MPAPCFAQEFAPTSVAFAETQSMFLDSLMGDADWLARYALNDAGESMPLDLIKRRIENEYRLRAYSLRRMLVVSYVEKAIYEMSEEELTAENILRTIRELEEHFLTLPASSRPVLSIPHLLAGEASAYYHGYTLAQMAVYQTRAFFLKRDGRLMDNPAIGRDLAEHYWRPGNSRTFLQMIEDLTGEPFSARATVALVNKPMSEAFAEAEVLYENERTVVRSTGPIDLGATITIAHGDQVIASTADGDDFETVSAKFGNWIRSQE
jgi:Zn-dependent oligopeptidase